MAGAGRRAAHPGVDVGQEGVIERLLAALFAGGRCLVAGVPGLAKTLPVSTAARNMNLKTSRIQFTPDLMPGDITGTGALDRDAGSPRRSRARRFCFS